MAYLSCYSIGHHILQKSALECNIKIKYICFYMKIKYKPKKSSIKKIFFIDYSIFFFFCNCMCKWSCLLYKFIIKCYNLDPTI